MELLNLGKVKTMKKTLTRIMVLLFSCATLAGCNMNALYTNSSVQLFVSVPTCSTQMESQSTTLPASQPTILPAASQPTNLPASQPTTLPASQPTTSLPITVPPAYAKSCFSTTALLEELEIFSNVMGSIENLNNILRNGNIKLYDEGIHRAVYTNWGCESNITTDAYETIELYFHPDDYCKKDTNASCSNTGDKIKLRVRILYKSGTWTQNDFVLDNFELINDSPLTFRGALRNGTVTQFYYFLNDHFVCLLSVDTEYMEKNSNVIEQFQKYCLSLV